MTRPAIDRPRQLAMALALPPLSWVFYEYGLGSMLGNHCVAVGAWLGVVWGAASLSICALAGFMAWRLMSVSARRGEGRDPSSKPWLARLATVGAGIFALAIAFQTLATLMVPSCVH